MQQVCRTWLVSYIPRRTWHSWKTIHLHFVPEDPLQAETSFFSPGAGEQGAPGRALLGHPRHGARGGYPKLLGLHRGRAGPDYGQERTMCVRLVGPLVRWNFLGHQMFLAKTGQTGRLPVPGNQMFQATCSWDFRGLGPVATRKPLRTTGGCIVWGPLFPHEDRASASSRGAGVGGFSVGGHEGNHWALPSSELAQQRIQQRIKWCFQSNHQIISHPSGPSRSSRPKDTWFPTSDERGRCL